MDSPLALLHQQVGTMLNVDTRAVLLPDATTFDFVLPFPGRKNCNMHSPIQLYVQVEYCGEKDGTALEVRLQGVRHRYFKDVLTFFEKLSTEVELFLNSSYEVEDAEGESCIPAGYMYAQTPDDCEYILPTYVLPLPFEKGDTTQDVRNTFNSYLQYACTSMWFASPILQYVSEHECEPKAPERMRLLSISHGTAQVFKEETELGKGIKFNYPEGIYRSRRGSVERRFAQVPMQ